MKYPLCRNAKCLTPGLILGSHARREKRDAGPSSAQRRFLMWIVALWERGVGE
jgi:hypothetical protein